MKVEALGGGSIKERLRREQYPSEKERGAGEGRIRKVWGNQNMKE